MHRNTVRALFRAGTSVESLIAGFYDSYEMGTWGLSICGSRGFNVCL